MRQAHEIFANHAVIGAKARIGALGFQRKAIDALIIFIHIIRGTFLLHIGAMGQRQPGHMGMHIGKIGRMNAHDAGAAFL